MIIECQQHPDYQQAIQTLLDLAEEYGSHANTLTKGGADTVSDARSNLIPAEEDLKVNPPPTLFRRCTILPAC